VVLPDLHTNTIYLSPFGTLQQCMKLPGCQMPLKLGFVHCKFGGSKSKARSRSGSVAHNFSEAVNVEAQKSEAPPDIEVVQFVVVGNHIEQ